MENNAIQVIDEIVLIKEVTFTNFITEARTGTMTFIRPENGGEEIHCEFIDKDRKIAKAITELPTEVSFRIHMKYRFLINDETTMLIDVVDAYLNNDFRIHVYRGYLALASVEIDEKRNFKLGRIHTTKDGSHGEYIDTDEVSEEGSDIFVVYNETVYNAMTFFLHMVHCTNRRSPVLILYHETEMEKRILSFKFTDAWDEKDKELFNTINSTDYRLSTYCESDGTVLPKFDYYMDGKIDGIHFYVGEEGSLMILSFEEKVTKGHYRINISNVTAIDYFMSNAMSFSQMQHRFYLHDNGNLLRNSLHGMRCYAIDPISQEDMTRTNKK